MTEQPIAAAHSSRLYRLLLGGYSAVRCTRSAVQLQSGPRTSVNFKSDEVEDVLVDRIVVWRRLSISLADGRMCIVGGVNIPAARAVADAVSEMKAADRLREKRRLDRIQRQKRKAGELAEPLAKLHGRVKALFNSEVYVRHDQATGVREAVARALDRSLKQSIRQYLPQSAVAAFDYLWPLRTAVGFEAARHAANDAYAATQRETVRTAAHDLGYPPTDEQADAIATDEHVTLVLAGAGTGKTAVIRGKIAHLVRNDGVAPEQILVLAFNRKAAEEIRDRLPEDLKRAEVRTFHSFGLHVLRRSGQSSAISELATQSGLHERIVDDGVRRLVKQGWTPLTDFVTGQNVSVSPFDFRDEAAHNSFLRRCWRKPFGGGYEAKNLEELEIANFLWLHGVEYECGKSFRWRSGRKRKSCRFDFFLPEHDIYIEHFELNGNNRIPPHPGGLSKALSLKREAMHHLPHGTRVIETYSWMCQSRQLGDSLKEALARAGVELRRLPGHSLIERLPRIGNGGPLVLARLLTTFLHHTRTANLTADDLWEKAAMFPAPLRTATFLGIFESFQDSYEKHLAAEGTIDFHDLINRAASAIREKRSRFHYRYVLVDEFQDISAGRMALLEALRGPDVAFFVVGDDWQSIYRFAGSDVSLVPNCGDYLGHVRRRELSATFRYREGILGPTAAFVQRNPKQTQRELVTRSNATDEGVAVVAAKEQLDGVQTALRDIAARLERQSENDRDADNAALAALPDEPPGPDEANQPVEAEVLVLGRYRNSRPDLPENEAGDLKIEFSTVHRAKGLEADYAIVLDLKNDRRGFPSRIEDDPLMDLVLPAGRNAVPHAEERRLFYVAATRAKRGTYLIADAEQPSEFVVEVLQSHPELRQIGRVRLEPAPRCPRCEGSLVPSQSGKNLRCTYFPMCPHMAPRCTDCDRGFLLREGHRTRCTNAACQPTATPCPECRLGVLTLNDGSAGPFWGCSDWLSEPPCGYTANIRR
ncbi:MAG: AAA family ATPase [Holophagales bacterium]|nr:AAA family ATPase [Holophagales bacterium]MYH23876.1 AAA family ATPase [Holophagales bacterium]